MDATETLEVEDDDFDGARMDTEIVVDYEDGNMRGYVEIGVDQGETYAGLHIEDGPNPEPVTLRLSADEIRDLIASLERALETVEANS